ncbi:uncharacterized protein [Rutidosis leptorrhynchoides]|uniref:uncharacterized protein n=1 Tax=Rutidosis leptorrhynchoides TaxID=125765 RepID=UPI003A993FCE
MSRAPRRFIHRDRQVFTSFSININGELHGFFRGRRGLRQGNPMSPYLFTLVMEVLTLMITRNIARSLAFKFHSKCDKLKIVNLCFADDLFIFAHANLAFVQVIRDSLEKFKRCSGLVPSLPKNMFIKDIEKLLRDFLWCQGPMKRGKAKVEWDDVCRPKDEGGLGIKRLKNWNVALMATHVWHILTVRPSIWVTWIYEYKLANQHFWSVDLKAGAYWSWRKILLIRPQIRNCLSCQVGDGRLASAWYNSWSNIGIFADIVSHRDIVRAGWNDKSVVRELMDDVGLNLPHDWNQKYPILQTLVPPILSNHPDKYGW